MSKFLFLMFFLSIKAYAVSGMPHFDLFDPKSVQGIPAQSVPDSHKQREPQRIEKMKFSDVEENNEDEEKIEGEEDNYQGFDY